MLLAADSGRQPSVLDLVLVLVAAVVVTVLVVRRERRVMREFERRRDAARGYDPRRGRWVRLLDFAEARMEQEGPYPMTSGRIWALLVMLPSGCAVAAAAGLLGSVWGRGEEAFVGGLLVSMLVWGVVLAALVPFWSRPDDPRPKHLPWW